ncbi:MAG: IS110 family transposase [Chloroflexota bacterium]|nr:IS110 family transposase [Chloroflexota bacterium]
MDVIVERACGLDVHKRTVVACLITPGANGKPHQEIRTFSTVTAELLRLADWLTAAGCTHVAMESTGIYWRPVYNILEAIGVFELLVVNAQHIKAVPGRKTDTHDAAWIATLLRHGLLRGSFIPPRPLRELRDLTRYRSELVHDRVRLVNRLHKVLEDANIKLAMVATDVMGASGRAIFAALIAGETDPERLADLARGRLQQKRQDLEQALLGQFRPHHSFLLAELLVQIDALEEAEARVTAELDTRLQAEADALAYLDTIPGVNQRIAQIIIAEIGTDMGRFPSAKHLASWAGICPGNHESAGKRRSGKTRKGSRWLRQALTEAAHGASHTKKTYLAALDHRIAARRGKKKAVIAVAHAILVIVYCLLSRQEPYRELGANYFDERERQDVERRLVRRRQGLGYDVILQPSAQAA